MGLPLRSPGRKLQLLFGPHGATSGPAGHILFVHPQVVTEPPKIVIEALDEGLIVFPGIRDEDFVPLGLLMRANNLSPLRPLG